MEKYHYKQNILIGAGGVGIYFVPAFIKQFNRSITIYDGDTYEEKNLDRQLFNESYIGLPKVEAIQQMYGIYYINPKHEWFTTGTEINRNSILFVAVDNHTARRNALLLADKTNSHCIIMANDYNNGHAYFYRPEWAHTKLDPRVRYPEILTDKRNDPTSPPCTGEEALSSPQLSVFNNLVAAAGLWLIRAHSASGIDRPSDKLMPVEIQFNTFISTTVTVGDILQ